MHTATARCWIAPARSIPHGSLVALVGESGGGKSTLAGIIAGRKGAYRGSVRIGGVELRDATATSLMRAVTLVPTNGYLFAGTLRDNLLLAQPNATDAELLRALGRTRVAAFVQANGGLDMVINEGGTNLSAASASACAWPAPCCTTRPSMCLTRRRATSMPQARPRSARSSRRLPASTP